jgi:hypothetical protein
MMNMGMCEYKFKSLPALHRYFGTMFGLDPPELRDTAYAEYRKPIARSYLPRFENVKGLGKSVRMFLGPDLCDRS